MKKALAVCLGAMVLLFCFPAFAAVDRAVVNQTKEIVFDVAAKEENGSLYLPVRFVLEGIGAQVSWDGETQTVGAVVSGDEVHIPLGGATAQKNGAAVELDASPRMTQDRVLLKSEDLEKLFDFTILRQGDAVQINYASYYPTQGWEHTTPEAQGMDSAVLADMLQNMLDNDLSFNSCILSRNGKIVSETYFSPYGKDNLHAVYSCTKSVISALCGIAIGEGKIQSADQKVADFYPELKDAAPDPYRDQLTISHLLTLNAGLNDLSGLQDADFAQSKDWPLMILSQPFAAQPGTVFRYDNWAPNVLAGVLSRATGKSVEDYAVEKLFGPLGITDFRWDQDGNGLHSGGYGLYLKTEDMLKFGYLYAKDGKWEGRQVIPKEWAITSHVAKTQSGAGNGYGYLFWTGPITDAYYANGSMGQNILVIPKYNLVAAFTADFADNNMAAAYFNEFADRYLKAAVKSNEPLPENKVAHQRLLDLSEKAGAYEPVMAALPETAKRISGRTIDFDAESGMGSWCFLFDGTQTCVLQVQDGNLSVGLDGGFRFDEEFPNVGYRAQWLDETRFEITEHHLDELYQQVYRFTIDGDNVTYEIVGPDGNVYGSGAGKLN